ncbi:hypothetical protein KJ059_00095 [Myxococcota bacterium]|nr:hypothetical protein [Myxococcota bacterium]
MSRLRSGSRSLLRLLVLGAAIAYLGLAAAWTGANLGDIPHYGDTMEYLAIANGRIERDSYRGPLYPALLRGLDALDGPPRFRAPIAWERARTAVCRGAPVLIVLQVGQFLLCALALVCFVRATGFSLSVRRVLPVGQERLLVALLLFDPLVAHFSLAVMPDSLALSASLLFLVGVIHLARMRTWPHQLAAASVALVSFLVAAGVRPEKRIVLIAVLFLTGLVWFACRHRRGVLPEPRAWRRAGVLFVCVGIAALAISSGTPAERSGTSRWDLSTTILHQRVIWPHLTKVYDELPASVQERIPRHLARFYDERIHNPWHVFNETLRADEQERRALTRAIVPVVLAELWPELLLDVAGDMIENVFATPSYYARLAVWMAQGEPRSAFEQTFEATPLTYFMFAWHHPLLSRVYTGAGAAVTAMALALALGGMRRRRLPAESWWAIVAVPVGLFLVTNAGAFAASANLVHIRYALAAHVVGLLWVYRGALAWWNESSEP